MEEGDERSMTVGIGSVISVGHINQRDFIIIRSVMDNGTTVPIYVWRIRRHEEVNMYTVSLKQ